MAELLARLKQRKLVQWALAYIAFAFALLQGMDVVVHQFGWPDGCRHALEQWGECIRLSMKRCSSTFP